MNIRLVSLLFFLTPLVASAQAKLNDVFEGFLIIIDGAIPVVIGIAVLAFLWGLARYVLRTDTVEGREGAKSIMIWGVITIFVMVALWAFVFILGDLFGVTPGQTIEVPQLGT